MKSIREILPRASQDCIDLNPLSSPSEPIKMIPRAGGDSLAGRSMTKPEREMAMILEAMRRNNEIESWKFEGMTLKLADGCRFTPDFFVVVSFLILRVRFVETKGPFIREDSMIKFKVAREQNGWAEWQLHQRNKNGWTQLI